MHTHTQTHTQAHTHIYALFCQWIILHSEIKERKLKALTILLNLMKNFGTQVKLHSKKEIFFSTRTITNGLAVHVPKINSAFVCIYQSVAPLVGLDTRSIFKQSTAALNSGFSFSETYSHIKAKGPSLPYYLPIAKRRKDGFIPFPRA